jgi:CubicO group peptidase (beta-lactamase class C family)
MKANNLKSNADRILSQAAAAGDPPGVVAMATSRAGTLYEGACGKRVLGQEAPMTLDTVVALASMTKAITATAAMQLVEQGKLVLEGPASRWTPELASIPVLEGFDAAGQPRTRPPKRPITLRHLLTHTAGFGYEIWNSEVQRYVQATGMPPMSTGMNAALRTPLLFDPGERWQYGINTDWVGKVIEAVSGKRLGTYLKENVLDPLGMNDTAFKITPAMRKRLAKHHQRGEDGKLAPVERETVQDPEFEAGGGGLYSTAGDYLHFVRMILNGGKGNGHTLLKPETVQAMSRNQMGDLRVRMLHTHMPHLSNDAEFFPGMPKQWGFAFQITMERAPTGRSPGSLSWAGLPNTYYWIDPTLGIGGVYLTQILPFADKKSLDLFYEFEKAVYRSVA